MDVVIVESPAKAKTINKYLGPGFAVLPSYGHVRDLKEKDGAVEPDNDFAMHWEISDRAKKALAEITQALKSADRLYLATDPDREGEAISWHLKQVLAEAKKLRDIEVKRVVFNEITKSAVLEAMKKPRDLDRDLVEAYLARRALDFLVGFTLSPVLWRKLPGSRSAGRVQSVALRLICEREKDIERFRAREYWSVDAEFRTAAGAPFLARLTHLDERKLDRFDLADKAAAETAKSAIEAGDPYAVIAVEKKRVRRNPLPPFTTSTLQQEASRKLGFSATRTMRVAQQLYEGIDIGGETVGLITYMRTDSVNLSQEAIRAARALIADQYGKDYLPDAPRLYKSPAKNAQEAHEAVRPTDLFRRPEQVARRLGEDHRRLYELIWRRTVASEMESAALDQVAVDVASQDRRTVLHATGSTIAFDGFLRLYREDRDDPIEDDEEGRTLPSMAEGDAVRRGEVKPEQHFTQPPPRYSEASLVKRLEELGIGRPSTYASILQVLQDRDYVRLEKRRFIPEDRGRLVIAFLEGFFRRYVEYDFTAKLEDQLDEISGGRVDWKAVLRDFWRAFSEAVANTKDLTITQVIDSLDAELGPHFFPAREDGADPRRCPSCGEGRLGLKLGKFGAFVGCSRYPECRYTRRLGIENGDGEAAALEAARTIGVDPSSGEIVSLRKGPYGLYLQLGEGAEGIKPKRVSLPRDIDAQTIDLDMALKLLALPRAVGPHPETGDMITAGLGRFGPYLKHGHKYKSLGSTQDLLTVGLNRAVDILAQPGGGRRAATPAGPTREIGTHPDDGKPLIAGVGRYGPYVKHGSVYANLSKGRSIEEVTLDEAVALIAERIERKSGKSARKSKAKPGKRRGVEAAMPPKKTPSKKAAKSKRKTPAPAADDVV
ncbi:MAG TPA: type I DNA topoisomerase [Alphaproteobacteria bacterium]|nr:type I DNA topoisomerase [Alphaproteobacteria bacterium]